MGVGEVDLGTVPPDKTAWTGIWEHATGARFAFLMGQRYGFSPQLQRGVQSKIRPAVVAALASGTPEAAPGHWQSGFFVNAAYQRIVWAEERLAWAIAHSTCECGTPAPKPKKPKNAKRGWRPGVTEYHSAAVSHARHINSAHGGTLGQTQTLLSQFSIQNSDLALVRGVLNSRKHGDYPTWSGLTPSAKRAADRWEKMTQREKANVVERLLTTLESCLAERPWKFVTL